MQIGELPQIIRKTVTREPVKSILVGTTGLAMFSYALIDGVRQFSDALINYEVYNDFNGSASLLRQQFADYVLRDLLINVKNVIFDSASVIAGATLSLGAVKKIKNLPNLK